MMRKKVQPLFPFGHGLSYTKFEYGKITTSGSIQTTLVFTLDVKNVGSVKGLEVVQLYIGYPAGANEPPMSLKGFEKVHLDAGQTKKVTFALHWENAAIWNVPTHDWTLVRGSYKAFIGSSSRDIRQQTTFNT